jgi:SAM-dependent methyltransferase
MTFLQQQKRYWQQQQQRRDPNHPAVAGFARPKVDIIKKWLPIGETPTILEIGAGDGYLTSYLRDLGVVTAIDFSLPMLRENCCDTRTVADALHLPFRDRVCDVVVEANLLHHVAQPAAVVQEMSRVSKSLVVLIEPNRWNPLMLAFGLVKREERKTLLMCSAYLKGLVQEAGLTLVDLVAKGFVTPNRMPLWLAHFLRCLERPSRFAAYLVAVGRRLD